jgi:starch synthase
MITIHNGLYQGNSDLITLFTGIWFNPCECIRMGSLYQFFGCRIKCAWAVTTVSPNYLNEINYSANGLESLFNMVRYKSRGILNGIDTSMGSGRG